MIKQINFELKKISLENKAYFSEDFSFKKNTEKAELTFEISKVNNIQKIIETTIDEDFCFSIGFTNSHDFKINSSKSNKSNSYCLFKTENQNNCLKIKSENGFPIMKIKKTEDYEIQEKIKNDIIFNYKLLKNQALNFLIKDKNNNFSVKIYDKNNISLCRFCNKYLPDLLKQDKSEKFLYGLNDIILSIPTRNDFKMSLSKTDDEKNFKNKNNYYKNFGLFSYELNPSSKLNHWFLCYNCYLAEFSSNNTTNKSHSEIFNNNSERESNNIENQENKESHRKTLIGNTLIKVDEEYYTAISLRYYLESLFEKFNFIKDFFSKLCACNIKKETFFQERIFMQFIINEFRNKLKRDKLTYLIFSAFSVLFEKYFNLLTKDLISVIQKKQSIYKFFLKRENDSFITEEDQTLIFNYLLIDIFSKKGKTNHVEKDRFIGNDFNIKRLQKLIKDFDFLSNRICSNEFNLPNNILNKNKESSSIYSKDLNSLTTGSITKLNIIKQSYINENSHYSKIKHKKEDKINRNNENKRKFFNYTSRIIDMSNEIDYLYKTIEIIKEKEFSSFKNSIVLNNLDKYINRSLCEFVNENQSLNIFEFFNHQNNSNLLKTQVKLNDELKNEELKENTNVDRINKIKANEDNFLLENEKCQNFVESSFLKEYGFLSSKEIKENLLISKSIEKKNHNKNKTKKNFIFRKTFQNEEDSIYNINKNKSAENSSIDNIPQNLKFQKSNETQENKIEIKFEKEENNIEIINEEKPNSNTSQKKSNEESECLISDINNKTNSSQIKKINSIKRNSIEIINSRDFNNCNNWLNKKPLLQMKDSLINIISSQESDNIQIPKNENKFEEEIIMVNKLIVPIDSQINNYEKEEELIDINKIFVEDENNKCLGIKEEKFSHNKLNADSSCKESCIKIKLENKKSIISKYKENDYDRNSKIKKNDKINNKSRTRSRFSKSLENRRNSEFKINNSKDQSKIENCNINLTQYKLKFENSKKEFNKKYIREPENFEDSYVKLRKIYLDNKKKTNKSKCINSNENFIKNKESEIPFKINDNNKIGSKNNEIIDLCDNSESDTKNPSTYSLKQEFNFTKFENNSNSKRCENEIFIRKGNNDNIFAHNLTNISLMTYNQSNNFFSSNNNESTYNNYFKTNNFNKNNNFGNTNFNNINNNDDNNSKTIIDSNNIVINKTNAIKIPNLNSNLVVHNLYSNYNHIENSGENVKDEDNSRVSSKAETDDVLEELFANSKKKKKINTHLNQDNLKENFNSKNEAILVISSVPNIFVEKIQEENFERLNLVKSFEQRLKEVFCKCLKIQVIGCGISSDIYKVEVYFKNNYLKTLNVDKIKEGLDFEYEKFRIRIEYINNHYVFTRCKILEE